MAHRIALLVAATIVACAQSAFACWATGGSPHVLVADADVILRARVWGLGEPPAQSSIMSPAETEVRLGVVEVLKGEVQFSLTVPGTLTDRPDMNDRPVPYAIVRRGGRAGECYARNYQRDGEYLLFLKAVNGNLTPYWAALAATNEQITGADDPWVVWVRQRLEDIRKTSALLPPSNIRRISFSPALGTALLIRARHDRPRPELIARPRP
jgi:hypothetical protein